MKHFRTPQSRRSEPRPTATAIIMGEAAKAVARGEVTMHIRPVGSRDHRKRFHASEKHPQILAIRPSVGAPTVCHVQVVDVRGPAERMTLGRVTFADARAAGYRTTLDFQRAWLARHDAAWVARQDVEADELDEAVVDARYARHAYKPAWAITFTLKAGSGERYLAARSDELYVDSPAQGLKGELAALSVDDFDRHIAKRRHMTAVEYREAEQQQRDEERRMLSREQRVGRLEREAYARGIDISREMWVLRRRLGSMTDQALERQIRHVEAKVFRIAA